MSAQNNIHPSAVIEKGAEIGNSVAIGPFCHIGAQAKVGDGVRLHANVVVMNNTIIGTACEIFPGAVLGGTPQDTKYKGEATRLEIGAHNIIREHVTMHIASVGGDGTTRVGDHCMFMAGAHVAHDCQVGNKVIMINHAVLGGHVQIADGAMIGGNSAVHQFVRIGMGAMVGGMTGVEGDVIPFGMAHGPLADLIGLNVIGMRRRGAAKADVQRVRSAYQALFFGEGEFRTRVDRVSEEYSGDPLGGRIIEFIRSA